MPAPSSATIKAPSNTRFIGIAAAVAVLCLIAGAIWLGNKVFGEKPFEVGDCVEVIYRTLDQDLKKTSCPSTFDPTSNVYEIVDVIDGSDSTCYVGTTEFSHEPHDKTYCLGYAAMYGEEDYGD